MDQDDTEQSRPAFDALTIRRAYGAGTYPASDFARDMKLLRMLTPDDPYLDLDKPIPPAPSR